MTPTPELLIYCCPLSAVDDELLNAYAGLLNAEEQKRLENLRSDAVRKVFLTSRALVRSVLAAQLQCAPSDLHFYRDHNDKPQLRQPATRWQFNLSHAGDWAVLALCDGGAVGVDVETHDRRNQLRGIAQRFFTAQENRAMAELNEEDWIQRFFELWTLKEAYVKALGRGIATALAGTDIEYRSTTEVALHLSAAALCEGSVNCWHYTLAPGTSLAAAVIGNDSIFGIRPRLHRVVPLRQKPEEEPREPRLLGRKV